MQRNSDMRPRDDETAQLRSAPSGLLHRFLADEAGTATISFLIWVPAFMFLLTFFTDLSLYFLSRTSMADVARETARQVAIRGLTEAEVAAYMEKRFQLGGRTFWVDVQTANNEVVLEVDVLISETTIFGVVELLTGDVMSVRATAQYEPMPEDVKLELGV